MEKPNIIPNDVEDGVYIVSHGRLYKAVGARVGTVGLVAPNLVWVAGCSSVRSNMSAEFNVREIESGGSRPAPAWKVSRSFLPNADVPDNYAPPPDDIGYISREEAVDACIELIGEDMGVDNGSYDPDLWGGLSWQDHAKEIKTALLTGGFYAYANLIWRVHGEAA